MYIQIMEFVLLWDTTAFTNIVKMLDKTSTRVSLDKI